MSDSQEASTASITDGAHWATRSRSFAAKAGDSPNCRSRRAVSSRMSSRDIMAAAAAVEVLSLVSSSLKCGECGRCHVAVSGDGVWFVMTVEACGGGEATGGAKYLRED